ncbi:MAG TPA: paraquat-inducible protein A [Opitutaceae bacterium]|nr:paraquat-inducible protein A [Opitutaceae bacterium]
MRRTAGLLAKNQQRAAAFAVSAAIMLVPANFLPVLATELPGQARTDTIFSGIVGLCEDGSWAVAAIVFTASILVPLLKVAGITTLLLAVRHRPIRHRRALTRLHATLDFIGRWSMLDVFLAGFLAGAVNFGALARVQPRSGILAFAAAVVLTMLATDAFDPQVLWSDAPPTEGTA